MYGTCTVHVRYMYGTCTAHIRYMFGTCTVHVRYMYGTCTVHVWYNMYGICMVLVLVLVVVVVLILYGTNFRYLHDTSICTVHLRYIYGIYAYCTLYFK